MKPANTQSRSSRTFAEDSEDEEEIVLKKTEGRGTAQRHHDSIKKAIRKKKLSDSWMGGHHYYNSLHAYSKNKIHCSCPMCSAKTNTKRHGRKAGYPEGMSEAPSYTHSDRMKMDVMDQKEKEFYEDALPETDEKEVPVCGTEQTANA